MRQIELFPFSLVRISGGPFEEFASLSLNQTLENIVLLHRLQAELNTLKDKICDDLYNLIPHIADSSLQNRLLNLKRDVFNKREITPAVLDGLDARRLPDTLWADLHKYQEIKNNTGKVFAEGKSIFSQEMNKARSHFKFLLQGNSLQNGLLLGSQTLLKRIPFYMEKKSDEEFVSKDWQTEQSLTKYLSRIYAKTSPFSTFTHLSLATIHSASTNFHSTDVASSLFYRGQSLNENSKVISHIRLNNQLFQYLQGLLAKDPEITSWLRLRINPTLCKQDSQFLFLTNNYNIEAFQRIPANPGLDVFITLVSQKREGILHRELVEAIIAGEYIDASRQEIEEFINKLIEIGFLEFHIGVSGLDTDWDIVLQEQLRSVARNVPIIEELTSVLQIIRELSVAYGKADVKKREAILKEAYDRFRSICMKLHEKAGLPEKERKSPEEMRLEMEAKKKDRKKQEAESPIAENEKGDEEEVFTHHTNTYFYFMPEQIFYEDAALDLQPQLNREIISPLIHSLDRLLQEMILFEGGWEEKEKMKHFFVEKYGPETEVDLLTFYEEYYREYKKPEEERLERLKNELLWEEAKKAKKEGKEPDAPIEETKNAEEVKSIPALQTRRENQKKWQEEMRRILGDQLKDKDEIRLTTRQLQEVNLAFPAGDSMSSRPTSFGSFIQIFFNQHAQGKGNWMAVVNSVFPGFGKMFSRFLHLFDHAITQELTQANLSLCQDDMFAEDCDGSFFNANLHPPLMPFEIWMPNGNNTLPPEKQIAVTDLRVKLHARENQLQLIHATTQKRVFVFDLGFQGSLGRSKLFQLLEKFSPVEYLFFYPLLETLEYYPEDPANPQQKPSPRIIQKPRIIYDDRIVLRRKTWFVPKEILPIRNPTEDHFSYFQRLQKWRKENGIPMEIFAFVTDLYSLKNMNPRLKEKVKYDDYKPQYISFKNPFLIKLFEKMVLRVPYALRIEEMLPDSDQLLSIGDKRHVTEFVLQWIGKTSGSMEDGNPR